MKAGAGSTLCLRNSSTISLVLLVLSTRLLFLPFFSYEPDDSGVVWKCADGLGGVDWKAVMCIQGKEGWAQHTGLWGACAECDGGIAVGADLDHLWLVSEQIPYLGLGCFGKIWAVQHVHQDSWDGCVECEAVIYKEHSHVGPSGLVQCGGRYWWHHWYQFDLYANWGRSKLEGRWALICWVILSQSISDRLNLILTKI